MNEEKYLITAALPYANGELHLGHLAGAYLPSDIYVRYLRAIGKKVLFVCGSDEHGAAIDIRAKKENITPEEIVDKYHGLNGETFRRLGLSFDIYHRTSAELHHQTASEFFQTLAQKDGQLEKRETLQWFDEQRGQFLPDRYVVGTCPRCAHSEAYGDQCEKCGSDLEQSELLDPISTLSGTAPVLKPTTHWHFRIDQHQDWLKEWLQQGTVDGVGLHDPAQWRSHVTGQCSAWLEQGLEPRSITRDLEWGIPVPLQDPDAKGKVLYVWFDAPIGYISATKQWALDNGENWEDYWKNPDTKLVHFIGKDNIVFHCTVFPAMLKAHGGFILPTNVPANQFLNFEGRKFSKSKGWGIEQREYLELFSDFEGKEDALRFYLTKIAPEQKDSDFKWQEFVDANDNELVANVGNFVNRTLTLIASYFEGKVPESPVEAELVWGEGKIKADDFLDREIETLVKALSKDIENYKFRDALKKALEISSKGNSLLQQCAPWSLRKTNPDAPEIAAVLWTCAQICGVLSSVLEPFVPFGAEKLKTLLALQSGRWGDVRPVASGTSLPRPELLFVKIKGNKAVESVVAGCIEKTTRATV